MYILLMQNEWILLEIWTLVSISGVDQRCLATFSTFSFSAARGSDLRAFFREILMRIYLIILGQCVLCYIQL